MNYFQSSLITLSFQGIMYEVQDGHTVLYKHHKIWWQNILISLAKANLVTSLFLDNVHNGQWREYFLQRKNRSGY